MAARFCTNCGAPLNGPFCSECGADMKSLIDDIEVTAVRPGPLVPPPTILPPPAAPPTTPPPPIAPQPHPGLPPLYAPPSPTPGPRHRPSRRQVWLIAGAILAVVIGAVTVILTLCGGASHPSVAAPPPSATITGTSPLPPTTEPGTRSALVPGWANPHIGRLVTAQLVLGANGTSVFVSPGHNTCAVLGSRVSCVATPMWHKDDPAKLPGISAACSTSADGRWSVFTVGPADTASVEGCTTTPAPLTLGGGTAPDNTVIAMGSSGILCLIDARKGVPTSQTGVACWNPATNHGFMITNQDKRLW